MNYGDDGCIAVWVWLMPQFTKKIIKIVHFVWLKDYILMLHSKSGFVNKHTITTTRAPNQTSTVELILIEILTWLLRKGKEGEWERRNDHVAPEEQRSLNLVECLEENGSFSHQFALPLNQLSCPALVLAVRRGDYLLLTWPVSVTEFSRSPSGDSPLSTAWGLLPCRVSVRILSASQIAHTLPASSVPYYFFLSF